MEVFNNRKKLTKDDLYIGLVVTIDQLSEIYGLHIFLDDYNNEKGGKIIYFANKEVDSEARDAVSRNNGEACIFYQLPEYEDNEVEIYE